MAEVDKLVTKARQSYQEADCMWCTSSKGNTSLQQLVILSKSERKTDEGKKCK